MAAFDELYEWNLHLLRRILEDSASSDNGPTERLVGDFYKAAMNTERIEELRFKPILGMLERVKETKKGEDLARCIAELHTSGVGALFNSYSQADKKNSSIYALYFDQGGLSLPDREYYLADSFAEIREAYRAHVGCMFALLGESEEESKNSPRL